MTGHFLFVCQIAVGSNGLEKSPDYIFLMKRYQSVYSKKSGGNAKFRQAVRFLCLKCDIVTTKVMDDVLIIYI